MTNASKTYDHISVVHSLTVGTGGDVDGLPLSLHRTQSGDPIESHHFKAVGGVRSETPDADAPGEYPAL